METERALQRPLRRDYLELVVVLKAKKGESDGYLCAVNRRRQS